jgi:hypothetical protein
MGDEERTRNAGDGVSRDVLPTRVAIPRARTRVLEMTLVILRGHVGSRATTILSLLTATLPPVAFVLVQSAAHGTQRRFIVSIHTDESHVWKNGAV